MGITEPELTGIAYCRDVGHHCHHFPYDPCCDCGQTPADWLICSPGDVVDHGPLDGPDETWKPTIQLPGIDGMTDDLPRRGSFEFSYSSPIRESMRAWAVEREQVMLEDMRDPEGADARREARAEAWRVRAAEQAAQNRKAARREWRRHPVRAVGQWATRRLVLKYGDPFED